VIFSIPREWLPQSIKHLFKVFLFLNISNKNFIKREEFLLCISVWKLNNCCEPRVSPWHKLFNFLMLFEMCFLRWIWMKNAFLWVCNGFLEFWIFCLIHCQWWVIFNYYCLFKQSLMSCLEKNNPFWLFFHCKD